MLTTFVMQAAQAAGEVPADGGEAPVEEGADLGEEEEPADEAVVSRHCVCGSNPGVHTRR